MRFMNPQTNVTHTFELVHPSQKCCLLVIPWIGKGSVGQHSNWQWLSGSVTLNIGVDGKACKKL